LTATTYASQAAAKTGFSGLGPFVLAIYSSLSLTTNTLRLSVTSLYTHFGAAIPSNYVATSTFTQGTSGGRYVSITAVNGVTCSITAAIDTGNSNFISYNADEALSAAESFPLLITFQGGQTITISSAPTLSLGTTTQTTSASSYDHNVLALGFLSLYDVTFDDTNKIAYFSTPLSS